MSEVSQFTISKLGKKFSLELPEFEAVLELFPGAILLIDAQTLRILYANGAACELSSYTRSELCALNLRSLVSDWREIVEDPELPPEDQFDEATQFAPRVCELNHRTRPKKIEVLVHRYPLPPRGKHILLSLEPNRSPQSTSLVDQVPEQLWESLTKLSSAFQQTGIDTALEIVLQAGSELTGAEVLAIYQADEQKPGLHRCCGKGKLDFLPEILPPQELILLHTPQLWVSNKRPVTILQRAALAGRMYSLTSAPLGQFKAMIGLVVIADSHNPPPEGILSIAQLLAQSITTIFQQHSFASLIDNYLQENIRTQGFSTTVEESVQEGLLVLNPDLNILRMNPAAEMILEYAGREVIGQPAEKILIGTETLIPALLAAQMGSASYNLGNVRLYRRSGEAFLAYVRTLPVILNNHLEGIVVLIRDQSEQEQIREHTQQLEQRAILGEVTAIFAHEVRNPINNISTGLELLALNLDQGDPNLELIIRLQQDCDRLAELMKSVLSFARPTDYEMEPVDVGKLLHRLLERLRPRINRVNVQYNLQVTPDCPTIQGNLRALEQVFNNLINNALQAMNENGGHLVIKVQCAASQEGPASMEVSIADSGPGIAKEDQERIFQPFFTTNRNGTGLGLAIAKRIITAHKGNIRVTSFPGGTVFHIQFPLANSPAQPANHPTQSSPSQMS